MEEALSVAFDLIDPKGPDAKQEPDPHPQPSANRDPFAYDVQIRQVRGLYDHARRDLKRALATNLELASELATAEAELEASRKLTKELTRLVIHELMAGPIKELTRGAKE